MANDKFRLFVENRVFMKKHDVIYGGLRRNTIFSLCTRQRFQYKRPRKSPSGGNFSPFSLPSRLPLQ